MEESGKNIESVERDISYFDKMVAGAEKIVKSWKIAVLALIVGWVLTIAGFIWYLNQYDFVSNNEANGIYAMIDSDGNIVAQDVTPEQWESFTKWWELNGDSQKK